MIAIILFINGEETVYFSADTVESDDPEESDRYPVGVLDSLTPSGMPPHELRLKPRMIVMSLRNLNVKAGLCNGTRLIIRKLHRYVIKCEIVTGVPVSGKSEVPTLFLFEERPTRTLWGLPLLA